MYEAVVARPEGRSTVARMALTAAEYGFEGIVVRNAGDQRASYDPEAIREEYGIDVVDGVDVVAPDPSTASGHLGNHRPKRTIVAVRGGTDPLNRFAVEQPAVDVLARPLGKGASGEATADHVTVKTAADNGVRIELSLGPVLTDGGGSRVRAIQELRRLWDLIDHYDAPYVVTAGATTHLDLRAPRELQAIGDVLGLDESAVAEGLEAWCRLANRNRHRQSEEFVEPGVRRCTDE